jgi:SAM-dependent methyltransferase
MSKVTGLNLGCGSDLVYTSHFIEHIPLSRVDSFLNECFRVLKPKGILRIVTPDLANLAQELTNCLSYDLLDKAEWTQFEILDQCVRSNQGGEKYYWIKKCQQDPDLMRYIFERSGRDFGGILTIQDEELASNSDTRPRGLPTMTECSKRLYWLFLRKYWALVKLMIPPSIKDANITEIAPGERHYWLYTFPQLERLLVRVGFAEIEKVDFQNTNSVLSEVISLDVVEFDNKRFPRKGLSSLFIEARKS